MEVRILPPHTGKLDKWNQKVVAREAATREDDDLVVIRSVRPAFSWRDRLFRPEEVVVLKWRLSPDSTPDDEAPPPVILPEQIDDPDAPDSPPA
jgi:hypothetical protein